jgi:uncharacterized protein (TIGR02996 family)
MTDRDALMAAIAQNPDDAPRPVFADWPEEPGNPDRAAFIRAPGAVARLTEGRRRCSGRPTRTAS